MKWFKLWTNSVASASFNLPNSAQLINICIRICPAIQAPASLKIKKKNFKHICCLPVDHLHLLSVSEEA